MANATAAMADAKKAYGMLDDYNQRQAKLDKQIQAQSDAAMKEDAEIKSCAMDGSECQDSDGKCKKTDDEKGPYMSDDLVTCTDVKPEDQAFAGESWTGQDNSNPMTPYPKPTEKCKALKAKFEGSAFGHVLNQGATCPMVGLACDNTTETSPAEKKEAFLDYFAMAAECPPWCLPGSETSDGLDQDSWGICLTGDDVGMFANQIKDLPVYTAMGTGDRFPAGPPADLCRMANEFTAGFLAGAATPAPTAAPTNSTPPVDYTAQWNKYNVAKPATPVNDSDIPSATVGAVSDNGLSANSTAAFDAAASVAEALAPAPPTGLEPEPTVAEKLAIPESNATTVAAEAENDISGEGGNSTEALVQNLMDHADLEGPEYDSEVIKAHVLAKEMNQANISGYADQLNDTAIMAHHEAEEWGEQQKEFAGKAHKLNKDQEKLAADAAAANLKAKQDLAAFKAEATAKMEAANKASAAADAKLVAQNAEYAELKRNMTTANNADLKVIADRMAVEKTEIEKLKNEIAKENGVLDSIQKDMANKAAEFKATQEKIKSDYQDKVAELAAENKKNTDALNDEEAKAQAALAKRGSNDKAAATAATAALKAEEEANKAAATKDKEMLEERYASAAALSKKANDAYVELQKEKALALEATRNETKAAFAAKAAAAEADYQAKMEAAKAEKDSADHAEDMYKKEMDDQAKLQKTIDARSAAAMAEDAEIKECALDGTECLGADGKCKKTNPEKGPYMASDLVTCTDTKPEEQAYAGDKWVNLTAPLPMEPIPAPSAECIKLKAAFQRTTYGFALAAKEGCPLEAIACHNTTDFAAKKKAYLDFFTISSNCPAFCIPGTETSDGLNQDTNGICIQPEDFAMFKAQITDMPIYAAMGTNQRIGPGPHPNLCRMAHSFVDGFMEGAGLAPPAHEDADSVTDSGNVSEDATAEDAEPAQGSEEEEFPASPPDGVADIDDKTML